MRRSHHILVALFAAAAITAIDSHVSEPGASAGMLSIKSEARLSDSAAAAPLGLRGTVSVDLETKADRLQGARPCERQVWPYVATRCLVSADGATPRVSRMITVEQRGETGSDLMRIEAPRLIGR